MFRKDFDCTLTNFNAWSVCFTIAIFYGFRPIPGYFAAGRAIPVLGSFAATAEVAEVT